MAMVPLRLLARRGLGRLVARRALVHRPHCYIPERFDIIRSAFPHVTANPLMTSVRSTQIVQFHLSDVGEGIMEVTVKEWYIGVGDHVHQFDQICEVQSDKASVTITSRYDGVVKKIHFDVDAIAQTGDALIDIELDEPEEISGTGKPDSDWSSASTTDRAAVVLETESIELKRSVRALATPAVRRLSAEHRIDISQIQGTGKDGRVLKEDILARIEQGPGAATMAPQVHAAPAAKRAAAPPGGEVVQLKGVKRAMAKTMTESLSIPHFGYCDEIDFGKLIDMRKELKSWSEERGAKLTHMPFVLKACSMALLSYPILNGAFNASSETVTIKPEHNIGVAMDTPQGLLVPVAKGIEAMSVLDIAKELNRLQLLGAEGKLGSEDLTGATFSLSNIGSIGGTYAKPVIVPPQVAIGALGKIQVLPRFDTEGLVIKAQIVNVSWSCDHRVLDGATVARFSNLMKAYIEEPSKMVLEMH